MAGGSVTVRCPLRLRRKSENALGDDVPLDLVRSSVDRVRTAEEEQSLQLGQFVRQCRRYCRVEPCYVHRQFSEIPVPGTPEQLGYGRLRSRKRSFDSLQRAQRVHPQNGKGDPSVGDALAHDRIDVRSTGTRDFYHLVELAAEPDLVTEQRDPALECERCEGHSPSITHFAHHHVRRGTRLVEEDLVELGRSGELCDRAQLDAGLAHRDQQVRQPLVAFLLPVRAGEDEAPVGPLGKRGPHLLARDHPLVPVENRRCPDVGKVRPGVGLGVALAPELAPQPDRLEEALLLLLGPVGDEGRAEQALSEHPDTSRARGAHVLLVPDHLLGDRCSPAAPVGRPSEAGPAGFAEHLLPGEPDLEPLVLPSGAADVARTSELPDAILGDPGADLFAEGGVLGGVTQVHGGGGTLPNVVGWRRRVGGWGRDRGHGLEDPDFWF